MRAQKTKVRAQPLSAPKSSLLSALLQIPMENIEMSTHLLTKQRRTHNKRKQSLQILRLRKNRRSPIIRRLDMELVQTGNGKHGRALPREQRLGVFLLAMSILILQLGRMLDLP